MEIKHIPNIKVHNYFTFELRDAETNELKQSARAENIVLNSYWSKFATGVEGYDFWSCSIISLGIGTGTLARTRTSLFSEVIEKPATLISFLDGNPTATVTKEITLSTAEGNGRTYTEVGFKASFMPGEDYGAVLMTHALIQDSEGNPISIAKNDTSILIVRGVFYATILPGTGLGSTGVYNADKGSRLRYTMCGQLDKYWRHVLACWPVEDFSMLDLAASPTSTEMTNDPDRWSRRGMGVFLDPAVAPTWNLINKTITSPILTILESSQNFKTFRAIGGIGGVINLPNHDFFPPYPILGKNIGVGDGVTTSFNIGIPVIMEDSEVIYKNGIPQTRGVDYEIIYENNCTNGYENYYSSRYSTLCTNVNFGNAKTLLTTPIADSNYRMHDPLLLGTPATTTQGGILREVITVTEASPIWFDWLEPKFCNQYKTLKSYAAGAIIQYSDDNIVWQDVPNKVELANGAKWDLVKARYWRMWRPGVSWNFTCTQAYQSALWTYTSGGVSPKSFFFFGVQTPGLTFTIPPALNDVITADMSIDILYKTSNIVLRYQYGINVDFGEGS